MNSAPEQIFDALPRTHECTVAGAGTFTMINI